MKQHWLPYELKELWSLSPEEQVLLAGRSASNRLGFAILLKFFQITGQFPKGRMDVPRQAVAHLANELNYSHLKWEFVWEPLEAVRVISYLSNRSSKRLSSFS